MLFDKRRPVIVAGPCSAESREQVMATAQALNGLGIQIFRAGAWKPRTKPGGFEGRGEEALPWLAEVKAQTGMMAITEVATAQHLKEALSAGIDGIWIGARTTSNPFAVQEIADELSKLSAERKKNFTVFVKNPISPDLELWIGAIERLQSAGIEQIGAIHRGFGTFGKSIYRNEPRWAIPIELRRRMPGLPVLCDPSHIAGRADLVGPIARQAIGIGFDGLFLECHCCPAEALSDAAQQITPSELSNLLNSLRQPAEQSSAESLKTLRMQIDAIDDELISLLVRRMAISREIGDLKRANNLSILQPLRYKGLMETRVAQAGMLGLDEHFIRTILAAIHEESVKQQISEFRMENGEGL